MNKEEKLLRQLLEANGYDADVLFGSDVLNDKEKRAQLAGMLGDIVKSQSNNSTKIQKVKGTVPCEDFHLGFISDSHSRLYLLEEYLNLLDSIGGKCVVTGDITNGSNHFHGHDASLFETQNLTNDILSAADVMARHKDMFIGYVEGNHDQWITEGTSLLVGYIACKFAGVDSIYAKNVELVTQNVTKNGKQVPFNFLIVHGEGMPADVTNALKKGLAIASKQNVDAIIFGHTHKMGSTNATILSKNGNGKWIEKQVMAYNPGTVLEGSDYADKAGYPANTAFDGSVMHCSVVLDKDGKTLKKCIDLQNIMNVVTPETRAVLTTLNNKLSVLESKKYASKEEIIDKYQKLLAQYKSKTFKVSQDNGHYFIGINGTSDLYSPVVSEDIKKKIRADLKFVVSVAQQLPNVSVVLNGDLIFDYNKGYIEKKDYCSDIVADIQDLCEILGPIANKIAVINNGKMEEGIMSVERDKGNGRLSNPKKHIKELANYATQTLQLDERYAYAPYDKQDMRSRQLAIRNDQINNDNQKYLDKEYDDFMKKVALKAKDISDLDEFLENTNKKDDKTKKIKEALVKKLRADHIILDISNPEDQDLIEDLYPLSKIDLRMPNSNLIGNIFCKMLGVAPKDVKLNPNINSASTFKVKLEDGKSKTVQAYYCTGLSKFLREIPAKLTAATEPPDVLLLNNYVNKSGTDLQEFTTQIRISYFDKAGRKRLKDVQVIDSGSYAYSKYLTSGKVPTNMVYKVADVSPIFKSLLPKDSVNYPGNKPTRPIVEKFNCESVLNKQDITKKVILNSTKQSLKKTIEKFDAKNQAIENQKLIDDAKFGLN